MHVCVPRRGARTGFAMALRLLRPDRPTPSVQEMQLNLRSDVLVKETDMVIGRFNCREAAQHGANV